MLFAKIIVERIDAGKTCCPTKRNQEKSGMSSEGDV